MGSVSISNVHKIYGRFHALKGISIDIEDGEFVALVGPSGCGKSTLLRMVAGLEDITSGDIVIAGQRVNDLSPRERNVAMVFQNYALYPHMTVADNMGFSLRLSKVPKTERRRRVEEASRILGLESHLERYPGQLSGGQRQRVAMGRAIVRDTRVFLFDEPLSNLDAQLRVQMRAEIKQLHMRLRTTTVYVTHDQIEAMTMADRIVVMRDGVIEQVGSPLQLYDAPVNTFVARFIGSPSMNLLSGRVDVSDSSARVVMSNGKGFALPPGVARDHHGRDVTFGMRPEALALAQSGLEARVTLVEPTGSEMHVVLDLEGVEVTAVFRERIDVQPGDQIGITADPVRILLFDPETGQRL